MTDQAYGDDLASPDDTATPELAVRVLIWLLIGTIFLILIAAIAAVAQSLLTLIAGATTLIALLALAAMGYLTRRVVLLESRIKALEAKDD